MVYFFKCLWLCLIIYIKYSLEENRRLFRDFKVKQKEYAILNVNNHAQGQDHNVICQTAKCDFKSNTIYNVTSPECGNHYTCQECPASFGTDICYLGLTSEGWVNLTEGSLQLTNNNRVYTNNGKQKQEPSEKKGYEDEYDEDEDAFLELNIEDSGLFDNEGSSFVHKFVASQTFTYKDNHGEKWLAENKKQCQVDKDGNLDLSVRLIFQYFRSPLDVNGYSQQNEGNHELYQQGDNMSALELESTLESGAFFKPFKRKSGKLVSIGGGKKGGKINKIAMNLSSKNPPPDIGRIPEVDTHYSVDDITYKVNYGSRASGGSFLELGFFGGGGGDEEDDDGGDDSSEGGNAFTTVAKRGLKFSLRKGSELKKKIGSGIKFLYEKAQVMIAKPEVHIHFVVDDIRIKNCRQPLSWAGEMSSGAMLFVANQNFKVKHDALNLDFLKKGIRVHSSIRGIYDLSFNSCIQVHCTKFTPPAYQYVPATIPGKNFSISSKLMGYLNRPGPHHPHLNHIAGASPAHHPLNPHLAAPLTNPNAPYANPLNGLSDTASIHPHTAPITPVTQTGPNNAQNNANPPNASNKTPPVTNIPSFNGQNANISNQHTHLGGIVQSDGDKTRFYIFMGVGILVLILLGYFLFIK